MTSRALLLPFLLVCIGCGAQTKIDLVNQTKNILPVAKGGTGTATPNLIPGSNISIAGTWPNQTISATGSLSSTLVPSIASPTATQTAPTPAVSSECPATNSNHPFWWMQDENGNYRTLAAIDTFTDATNGPANATFVFCHHIALNDTGVSPIQGKNAAFSLFHTFGFGSVISNQDRGISIIARNGTSDTQAHYGLEGIQSEVDFRGAPTINGSPDGEVSAGSFQLSDQHTNNMSSPNSFGVNGIRVTTFRSNTGTYGSCTVCLTGIRSQVVNQTVTSFNNGFMAAGYFSVTDSAGALATTTNGVGIWIQEPSTGRLNGSNTGIRIGNYGTNSVDRNFLSVGSMPSNGKNEFDGPMIVATWTPLSATDTCVTGTITWDVNFVYICTNTNSWKRAAISAW